MIIQGKYNQAEVFTENIDQETIGQIIRLCNQEFFKDSKIRIMPDCHFGKGCTVGTTMTITSKIVPNLVGVDIGCGVAAIKLSEKLELKKVDNIIREHIPHGFRIHTRSREKLLKKIFNIDLHDIKGDADINRAFLSLGTLGGGNHFIEINETSKGEQYLIIHSGSRNLGKTIAEDYQRGAINYCKEKYIQLEDKKPQDDLCYLEGKLKDDYINDMELAQEFAYANRVVIIADILYHYYNIEHSFSHYCQEIKNQVIECVHNYIDVKNNILRKGAISAQDGETLLIPINMRDGIIIGKGKGNENWNYSAPHGAGRILSRGKAKQAISMEEFKKSMENVFSTSVSHSTLDEAPQAYKPIEDILDNIYDTVEIVEVIKPIYNFKSS